MVRLVLYCGPSCLWAELSGIRNDYPIWERTDTGPDDYGQNNWGRTGIGPHRRASEKAIAIGNNTLLTTSRGHNKHWRRDLILFSCTISNEIALFLYIYSMALKYLLVSTTYNRHRHWKQTMSKKYINKCRKTTFKYLVTWIIKHEMKSYI